MMCTKLMIILSLCGVRITTRQSPHNPNKVSVVCLIMALFLPLQLSGKRIRYVDLGLSVQWAASNLGAKHPQDCGDFYAWGESKSKDYFSWDNYNAAYKDVATSVLGKEWRLPTKEEVLELMNNCLCDTIRIDGVLGLRLISKVEGYQDQSIFIPYTGMLDGNEPLRRGDHLYLWSSTTAGVDNKAVCITTDITASSRYYSFIMGDKSHAIGDKLQTECSLERYIGLNIRPVRVLPAKSFTSLSFQKEQMELSYGEIDCLTAWMMPIGRVANSGHIEWRSSHPDVVNVSPDGIITAIGLGSTVITAQIDGLETQVSINVTMPRPEPVDLGLSVKWASANLCAASPAKSGAYFAWGETRPKAGYYDNENYRFTDSVEFNAYTKYSFGFTSPSKVPFDCKETLDLEDDAAHVLLGGGWRMPTANEMAELRNNCTWQHIDTPDSSGIQITSNVPGYEANSIFLPFAGSIEETALRILDDNVVQEPRDSRLNTLIWNIGYSAKYWTATLKQGLYGDGEGRTNGLTIRPVIDLSDDEVRPASVPVTTYDDMEVEHNAVDLGLSVLWAEYNVGACAPTQTGGFYAWGETEEKLYYSTQNYKYMQYHSLDNGYWWWYNKYVRNSRRDEESICDNRTVLEPADDAAHLNWGGEWRLPTKDEYVELFENCERCDTILNGTHGVMFTSKISGYTDNSIFLPYMDDSRVNRSLDKHAYYMTSDLSAESSFGGIAFEFTERDSYANDEVDLGFERLARFHIASQERWAPFMARAVRPR